MIGDTSKHTTREKERIGKVINRPIEMLPYDKNGDSSLVFKADNYNDRELLVRELEYVDNRPFGYLTTELDYKPTMTIDLANSAYNKIKLTGDLLIDNFLNQTTGSDYMLIIEQDSVGGHSLSINDENIELYLKGVSMLSELDTSPDSVTYIKMTSVKNKLYGEVLDFSTFEKRENESYFSFDVEIANSGDTFTLPIDTVDDANEYEQNFTADWGDDSSTDITSHDDTGATHTYDEPGTYTITMTGKSELFAVEDGGDKSKIVKLNNFFGDIGFKKLNFYGCDNLEGNIPTSFKNLRNLVDVNNLFRECRKISGNIPEDMFWNSPNITDMAYLFYRCVELTGEIPEKLFWYNPKVTTMLAVFYSSGVSGNIPEKLFWYNPEVIDFKQVLARFQDYPDNLTGSIPEKLFCNNSKVTDFSYAFFWRTNITGSIPEKLFWNNPEVTNFAVLFSYCTGLTGSIPEKLFWNNPKVTNVSDIFASCTGLTGNIPEKLFWNNPEIIETITVNGNGIFGYVNFIGKNNFSGDLPANIFINNKKIIKYRYIFSGCDQLTGDGWKKIIKYSEQYAEELDKDIETNDCFFDCTSLTDYDEIPDDWK